jgi:voltage-gated potassium channel Kch
VFGFVVVFRRLFRAVKRGLGEPGFRGLLTLALVLLAVGMLFYHRAEGWTLFQSLYFSVITLTTVGYGDFSPATFAGRLFTIFYVLAGVGIIVAFVSEIASHAASDVRERRERRSSDS